MPNRSMNRYLSLAAVMIAVVASHRSESLHAAEIHWLDSPTQAAELSRQQNLPVVMYVTSSHCGYCRKMEQQVWSNPDIASLVEEGFVPLKIRAEQHRELVAALKVRAYPTTIVFSPQAKPITGAAGFLNPTRVAAMLREASPPAKVGAIVAVSDGQVAPRAAKSIAWLRSAGDALEMSQESKRPILVYVSSNNCTHCRRMEQEVWSDSAVAEQVEAGFVPLALKAESDAALIATLNVKAYPTTILLSPERQVLSGLAGYVPVPALTALLQEGQYAPTAARGPVPSR